MSTLLWALFLSWPGAALLVLAWRLRQLDQTRARWETQ